jgi:D-alanine-D-alanine ligase
MWKGKRVAVLMGGPSKEREISLRTGGAISKALKGRGYDVVDIDMNCGFGLADELRSKKVDVALIALHGKFGEDGCIQGMLEMLRIPYTGGGVLASAVGMDKVVCNVIASELGIPRPDGKAIDCSNEDVGAFIKALGIELPVIVKPSREGSTINVTIVNDGSGLKSAISKAMESDSKIVVEKYIKGKEVTVGLLNGRALTPLEIAPKSGFYDYESKYTKGKTEYIIPARVSEACAGRMRKWSEMIYRAIDCDGTARADFIVSPDEREYFLEINTIPGMTELSLVPKAAAYEGMSFEDLCEELLSGAALKVK